MRPSHGTLGLKGHLRTSITCNSSFFAMSGTDGIRDFPPSRVQIVSAPAPFDLAPLLGAASLPSLTEGLVQPFGFGP